MNVMKFSVEYVIVVFVFVFCLFIGGLISYGLFFREVVFDIFILIVIVFMLYFGVLLLDMEMFVM